MCIYMYICISLSLFFFLFLFSFVPLRAPLSVPSPPILMRASEGLGLSLSLSPHVCLSPACFYSLCKCVSPSRFVCFSVFLSSVCLARFSVAMATPPLRPVGFRSARFSGGMRASPSSPSLAQLKGPLASREDPNAALASASASSALQAMVARQMLIRHKENLLDAW